MALTTTASAAKLRSYGPPNLNGLSLEAEIRSLFSVCPESVEQLPSLFAESVVESCFGVAGTSGGEALVRRIGDKRLRDPESVYEKTDALLLGGSATLKRSIEQRFRNKVHRLYKISMSFEAKHLSAP